MKKYRTTEQFNEIIHSAINGNWTQATKEVEEYGFYANDLIQAYNELAESFGVEDLEYLNREDLALLIPDKRN